MRLVYRPASIFTIGLIVQGIVMSTTRSMGRTVSDGFLSAKVDRFSVHKMSMVGALLLLGRQEKFPLGIEYIDQQAISKTLTLNIKGSTIAGALNAIVKTGKGYRWNIRNGVIDISNANMPADSGNLLYKQIPLFALPYRMPLEQANSILRISLATAIHPGLGTAGDFPVPTAATAVVGPLVLHHASVRDILNSLVRGAQQAAWIVNVPVVQLSSLPASGLWIVVEYNTMNVTDVEKMLRSNLCAKQSSHPEIFGLENLPISNTDDRLMRLSCLRTKSPPPI
jgi:hypothetical protein